MEEPVQTAIDRLRRELSLLFHAIQEMRGNPIQNAERILQYQQQMSRIQGALIHLTEDSDDDDDERSERARENWKRVRNVVLHKETEEQKASRRASNMRASLRYIRDDMNRHDGIGGGSLINTFLPNHQHRVSNISNLIRR